MQASSLSLDTSAGKPSKDAPRRKVLIVDDEKAFARLLKQNIEEAGGHEVRIENSARFAIETARSFMPDIIFLDVMMPDGSGGDVAAQFEKDPLLKKIPITFLTAAVRRAELGAPEGVIGGRSFIAKPPALDLVLAHIVKRTAAR